MTLLLLDTNVVSELLRPRPEQRVFDWVAAQPLAMLVLAAVTVMEIRFGIAVLPMGRRRGELDASLRQFLAQGFANRGLPFDALAADACADIRALRRLAGRPIGTMDAMIAGIAMAHGATGVTRDVGGFAGCGLALINPWQA